MRVGANINAVCEMFDLEVLTDITEVEDKIHACFAIGQEAEHGAGLVRFEITRWFDSEEELDEFCETNLERFRVAAKECSDNFAPVPDATEWR